MATTTPNQQQYDRMNQKPEAEALILIDQEQDQDAWYEECQDRWNPTRTEVEVDEIAIEPGNNEGDARQEQREDEKPQWEPMNDHLT
jgi:hypothetical protein